MELIQIFIKSSKNGHYQMLLVSKDKQTEKFSRLTTVRHRKVFFFNCLVVFSVILE